MSPKKPFVLSVNFQSYCEDVFGTEFAPPAWMFVLTVVEKAALILNASANFVYYCLTGSQFRHRYQTERRVNTKYMLPTSILYVVFT